MNIYVGKFNKDAWLKMALHRKHIDCDREGNVYRLYKDGRPAKKITLQTHKKSGRVYFNMTFWNFTKSVLVNRLMGIKYLPNPLNLPEVNHIDGVKKHNWVASEDGTRPTNLEWANRSDQEKHAFATGLKATRGSSNSNSKLTADQVVQIRHASYSNHDSIKNLAVVYGVSAGTIRNIVNRKTWTHI